MSKFTIQNTFTVGNSSSYVVFTNNIPNTLTITVGNTRVYVIVAKGRIDIRPTMTTTFDGEPTFGMSSLTTGFGAPTTSPIILVKI